MRDFLQKGRHHIFVRQIGNRGALPQRTLGGQHPAATSLVQAYEDFGGILRGVQNHFDVVVGGRT